MYSKFIKLIVLVSLLVCCGFAGRVLHGHQSVVQGEDPHHIWALLIFNRPTPELDAFLAYYKITVIH